MNKGDGELRCENVFKTYNIGKPNEFTALKGINMRVEEGEYVSIIGPSGSGKSTLLNIVSCLDSPTKGEVFIEGVAVKKLSETEKAKLRREKLGFIFQQFNLIPAMTCYENVELPMRFRGLPAKERRKRTEELLELVGLLDKKNNKPAEMSGGQQQRVAIARSLANNPKIILGDEPTGNLDSETGKMIMEFLYKLNKEENKTLIIVTHDQRIASKADRIIEIEDGKIKER